MYSTTPLEKGPGASSHTASNHNKHSHFQSDISLIPPGFKKSDIDGVLDQVVNGTASSNKKLGEVRRSLLPSQPSNALPRLNHPNQGSAPRGTIGRQQSPNITNIKSNDTDTADEELSVELTRLHRHDSNIYTQDFGAGAP